MALSVCLIFTVTIGTFPAVTVEVKSTLADGGTWGEFGPFNLQKRTQPLDLKGINICGVNDGWLCSVFRDLLHPGGVFPPLQHDGLGRPQPDRRLYVGQYRQLPQQPSLMTSFTGLAH